MVYIYYYISICRTYCVLHIAGKAFAFTSAVGALLEKYPAHDDGVAFIFQGSYYMAAPWPIRNPKKARENYDKAMEVCVFRTGGGETPEEVER